MLLGWVGQAMVVWVGVETVVVGGVYRALVRRGVWQGLGIVAGWIGLVWVARS